MQMMRKRLGDILLEKGWVDGPQLDSALHHQRQWGVPLGQVLVDLRLCTAHLVLEALAHQSGVPTLDLDAETLDRTLAQRMPRPLAERHRVIPLRMEGPHDTVLVVAIAAPASLYSLEAVRQVMSPLQIIPRLATDAAISRAIERLYRAPEPLPPRPPLALVLPEGDEDLDWSGATRAAQGGERLAGVRGTPCAEAQIILLHESEIVKDEHALALWTPPETKDEGRTSEVLIYGWDGAAEAMQRALQGAGFRASVADTQKVLAADETEVVLVPLPWLESLDQQPRARLLVAGKGLGDRIKAQLLGASGFLMAPVETDVLIHSVEQLVHTLH